MLLRGFVFIMFAATKKWTATVGGRVREIAAVLRRPATLRPEFYGLLDRHAGADGVNVRQNKPDASAETVNATQAWLPTGPSCC
jgi:hypothetical protein